MTNEHPPSFFETHLEALKLRRDQDEELVSVSVPESGRVIWPILMSFEHWVSYSQPLQRLGKVSSPFTPISCMMMETRKLYLWTILLTTWFAPLVVISSFELSISLCVPQQALAGFSNLMEFVRNGPGIRMQNAEFLSATKCASGYFFAATPDRRRTTARDMHQSRIYPISVLPYCSQMKIHFFLTYYHCYACRTMHIPRSGTPSKTIHLQWVSRTSRPSTMLCWRRDSPRDMRTSLESHLSTPTALLGVLWSAGRGWSLRRYSSADPLVVSTDVGWIRMVAMILRKLHMVPFLLLEFA